MALKNPWLTFIHSFFVTFRDCGEGQKTDVVWQDSRFEQDMMNFASSRLIQPQPAQPELSFWFPAWLKHHVGSVRLYCRGLRVDARASNTAKEIENSL